MLYGVGLLTVVSNVVDHKRPTVGTSDAVDAVCENAQASKQVINRMVALHKIEPISVRLTAGKFANWADNISAMPKKEMHGIAATM